eukprot:COSAG04_NODE_5093_length_1740_cov_18.860451_3_plen_56_part_00
MDVVLSWFGKVEAAVPQKGKETPAERRDVKYAIIAGVALVLCMCVVCLCICVGGG